MAIPQVDPNTQPHWSPVEELLDAQQMMLGSGRSSLNCIQPRVPSRGNGKATMAEDQRSIYTKPPG